MTDLLTQSTITRLRTKSGWWEGDDNAERVLAEYREAVLAETRGDQIGWFNPVSKRFAYSDEVDVWLKRGDKRVAEYHVPVFASHP